MNRFKNMNDDELNSFVKQNQPQAPSSEANELNLLKRKLNLKDNAAEPNNVWLWLGTGLAASFFMFHFLTTAPQIAPAPSVVTTLAETNDDEYTEADISTLDIGEEYLTLAGF